MWNEILNSVKCMSSCSLLCSRKLFAFLFWCHKCQKIFFTFKQSLWSSIEGSVNSIILAKVTENAAMKITLSNFREKTVHRSPDYFFWNDRSFDFFSSSLSQNTNSQQWVCWYLWIPWISEEQQLSTLTIHKFLLYSQTLKSQLQLSPLFIV